MAKTYYTFRIRLSNNELVRVEKWDNQHQLKGEPSGPFRFQEKLEQITSLLQPVLTNELNNSKQARKLGEVLFEAIFDDVLRQEFVNFYQEAVRDKKQLLRIELDIDEQTIPEVAALPWEFMCLPASANLGDRWLGTDPNIVFSRRRALWHPADPIQLEQGEKLRIALAIAAPKDLGHVEYEDIKEALANLAQEQAERIELLPIVNSATPTAIDNLLKQQPHIFHFIGHGRMQNEAGEEVGQIALVKKVFNTASWIDAGSFSELFNRWSPGVILLQACESGMLSASQAFAGTASKIVQMNIPVVVAMQYEVSNITASQFAYKFYERLAKGEPVDIAAQNGRRTIGLDTVYRKRDFATPVIFMRVQDGYLFNRESEESVSDLFSAIERNSCRIRETLKPYKLPLIRRDRLLEKCLKQIHISIEGRYLVIPILGAAGYGKSVILGTIYDELHRELVESGQGWVALARCDDLIESAQNFAEELGEKVSERRLSIVEIAKQLTKQRSPGVLLLDTLDIVLTDDLKKVLRGILHQLLKIGTTVVFTCRDQDYINVFEPYHESFAGFHESVNCCKISEFNDDEVREATRKFVQLQPGYSTSESQISFADKIIALSANSKPLQEIVQNPLLLAMLCDLFAESGNVPEDLTVSKLYDTYWNWRIVKYRHNSPCSNLQLEGLGSSKEQLCLYIAETLYKKSEAEETLRDVIYDGKLKSDQTKLAAYKDLRSEGVLKDLGRNRIQFFHQTFLEYAIARWFTFTELGEDAMTQLREKIRTNQVERNSYIWPIFRQLLTLIDLSEFQEISNELLSLSNKLVPHKLDESKISPFRAIVFAAVSHPKEESSLVLLRLINIIDIRDYLIQKTFLIAANSTPKWHCKIVLEVVIRLLERVENSLFEEAVIIIAELLTRTQDDPSIQFRRTLEIIKNRDGMQSHETNDNNYSIWGNFITNYSKFIKNKGIAINLNILYLLKEYYGLFGSNVRSVVIELYLTPDIPESAQREFLLKIIQEPLANKSFSEKDNFILLLKQLLPNLLKTGDTCFGSSWIAALNAPLDEKLMIVIAAAVGDSVKSDPVLLEQIINNLLVTTSLEESFINSNLLAVKEAIKQGEAELVASILLEIPIDSVSKNRISTLSQVLRTLSIPDKGKPLIDPKLQVDLAKWVSPIIHKDPAEVIKAIDALAFNSTPVLQRLGEILEDIINTLSQKKIKQIINELTHIPEQIEPYLKEKAKFKEFRFALLKLYEQQPEKILDYNLLIQYCLDDSQKVAQKASLIILDSAERGKPIDIIQLLPVLTQSRVVGVRKNCLEAFIKIVNRGSVQPSQILQVFNALSKEKVAEISQLLFQLIRTTIHNHPSGKPAIDLDIAEAAFKLIIHSLIECEEKKIVEMTAKEAFVTLRQLSILRNLEITPQIAKCSRALLRKIDIKNIDNKMITALFHDLAKFDSELLAKIVKEDFINNDKIMPGANQQAIVFAIYNNEGKNSPLLYEIVNNPKIPQETKSLIYKLWET